MNDHWEIEWLNLIEVHHVDEWIYNVFIVESRCRAPLWFLRNFRHIYFAFVQFKWAIGIYNSLKPIFTLGVAILKRENVFHPIWCSSLKRSATIFVPFENHFTTPNCIEIFMLCSNEQYGNKYAVPYSLGAYSPVRRPYSNKFYAFEMPLNIKSHTLKDDQLTTKLLKYDDGDARKCTYIHIHTIKWNKNWNMKCAY